jgi:hypothetical protein
MILQLPYWTFGPKCYSPSFPDFQEIIALKERKNLDSF